MSKQRINQRRLDDASKALKAILTEQQRKGATFEELNDALLFTLASRLVNTCPHCVRVMAFDLMDLADVNYELHTEGNA